MKSISTPTDNQQDLTEPYMASVDAESSNSSFAVFSIAQFRWLFLGNATFFLAMNGQMLTRTLLAWD
ncbi:MAG: hypothetical protein O3A71_12230, partial [Proteobacteria bacterium]|nr:hypothetical protein [Pseudomonadota bacterium]